ncbi:MAG: ribonuclease J [Anaerolineales bacterium]|nr:ribonuclease J [Anaerolineales bacterium]MCS7247662.1 ribonuclease J [Anaerolineales bacterium]MDW8161472.1 ribonuclease J [Anaerolineales bacterium]MDW8446895.1 ribonuclease J [Anaerolineales bacterium]
MKDKILRILPLGGLGEVGKNMMVYEYADQILVVDAGLMFPENDMLGIDYIIPDFQYLVQNRHKVVGIVFTHGHEDHTGAARHVLEQVQAPIYATALTRGLLEAKLTRNGLLSKLTLNTVRAGDRIRIGVFDVEFFHVCHSIPDGVGLGIRTPVGLVVHTGDYKFDHTPVDNWPTDFAKLASYSQQGVLALLADSTNSTRPGWTPSERVVDAALDSVFREAPGRIIVASFASLISRMQQVANAAMRYGRKLAFVGSSMIESARIARKLGYLDIPDSAIVSIEQALRMNPQEVVLMSTGTQGEPTSILGRLSTGTNRHFEIIPGDTVVLSSRPIPGNEESVYRTINRLFRKGANVIYEDIAPVHVSGHASAEEIKLMLNLVRPRFLIPIHGELRHLHQHARLAQEVGIPAERIAIVENGMVIELTEDQMRIAERIPGGYVFVDGASVGEVSPSLVREREALARDGFVLVNVVLDRRSGRLLDEPEVITRGFVPAEELEELLAETRDLVRKTVEGASNGRLQNDLEQTLKSFLYNKTKRRPMVFVTLSSA